MICDTKEIIEMYVSRYNIPLHVAVLIFVCSIQAI